MQKIRTKIKTNQIFQNFKHLSIIFKNNIHLCKTIQTIHGGSAENLKLCALCIDYRHMYLRNPRPRLDLCVHHIFSIMLSKFIDFISRFVLFMIMLLLLSPI